MKAIKRKKKKKKKKKKKMKDIKRKNVCTHPGSSLVALQNFLGILCLVL